MPRVHASGRTERRGRTGWTFETFRTSGIWLAALGLALAARPVGALSGYEITSDASTIDSNPVRSATAECPAGKDVIGGGARVVGNPPGVALSASAPPFFSSNAEWSVSAHEIVTTSANWGLEASAICGVVDDYAMVVETNGSNSFSPKFAIASCPGGTQLLGGGVRTFGDVTGVALQSSRPEPDFESPSPNAWYGDAEEIVASSGSWTLVVFAICGTVSDREVVYEDTVGADSTSPKSVDVSGSPGKLLLGGGSRLYADFSPEVGLTAGYPDVAGGGDPLAWAGGGREVVSTNGNWGLQVSAIYAPEPSGALALLSGLGMLRVLRRRRDRGSSSSRLVTRCSRASAASRARRCPLPRSSSPPPAAQRVPRSPGNA